VIPVLYDSTATTFTSCGIGELPDTLSSKVTEQRNGLCSLELEHPVDSRRYSDLAPGRLIKTASQPGKTNIFCIEHINYSSEGTVRLDAPQQVCLRLSSAVRFSDAESLVWMKGDDATGNDIYDVMSILRSAVRPRLTTVRDADDNIIVPGIVFTGDFDLPAGTFVTINWGKANPTAFEVVQAVAEAFGGEIEWGFNKVSILKARGEDTNQEIRYGVNMLALEAETGGEDYATAVMPESRTSINDYAQADSPGVYPFFRVAIADLGGKTAAEYLQESAKLTSAIKVEFDENGNAPVLTDVKALQRRKLCDTVVVVHPALELKQKAKIVEAVFESLLLQYDSLSIGEILKDITDTIAALIRGS